MEHTENLYRREIVETTVPVADFVQACVDVPKFIGYCKECQNYGTTWVCPPFDFDPIELWNNYRTLRLRGHILYPAEGAELTAVLQAMGQEREALVSYLMEQEHLHPGSLMLSVGNCTACKVCSRTRNEPCVHPEQCRHSIESLGGDVGKTAELYFGKPTLWIKDRKMPEYLMLVCGLLLRE